MFVHIEDTLLWVYECLSALWFTEPTAEEFMLKTNGTEVFLEILELLFS